MPAVGRPAVPVDVLEAPGAAVPEEHVLAEVGEEEIEAPVVVVVARADRRGPARAVEAGARGHVSEGAVAVVPIEVVGGGLPGGPRAVAPSAIFQPGAAQHQRIGPGVAVHVHERHPGPVGLDDEALLLEAAVHRRVLQPRRPGHVHERDRPGARRFLRSGDRRPDGRAAGQRDPGQGQEAARR